MIRDTATFVFRPPPALAYAARVLIKPCAPVAQPHPVTTSRQTLETVIAGIRRISDADIILLEGTPQGEPVNPIYRALGYDFPRLLTLDVRDCIPVEVENPLPKPWAISTFWLPNVVLSCDYLITVAPFKVVKGKGLFSIYNLLGLLPHNKYKGNDQRWADSLYELGIERVIADLYFTMPFDLGIVDARSKLVGDEEFAPQQTEDYGKIFLADPFTADREAAADAGVEVGYLKLIEESRTLLQLRETSNTEIQLYGSA
ncbi:MAG: DUF362 domain-containing protein [Chloroflexi bacterium]|nr:DUF362 domain-containing protein [Chloroflexota bacterium]